MKDLFEKLFASIPLTVLVLAVILLALGAIGGIPLETPLQTVDNTGRIVLVSVGAILLVAALGLVFISSNIRFHPNRHSFGITLDRLPGTNEDTTIDVEGDHPKLSGTYRKKPPDGVFHLFVYDPYKRRYWPQNPKNIEWKGGKWFGSVHMGGSPPYEMIIIAALVPPSGRMLCDYYREIGELAEKFRKTVGESSSVYQNFKEMYWKAVNGEIPEDMIIIGKVKYRRIK